jgi:hypothetical protein
MEIVLALFVLVGGTIGISAWMKSRSAQEAAPAAAAGEAAEKKSTLRSCQACGYQGEMKTWIASELLPKVLLVLGFLLGYLPGLIFLVMYWGKHKCPACGKIGKNSAARLP